MDFSIQVGASALFTRNIVQWFKDKGWIINGFVINIVTFIVNIIIVFILGVIMAIQGGEAFSTTLIKSVAATILSALYHDFISQKDNYSVS